MRRASFRFAKTVVKYRALFIIFFSVLTIFFLFILKDLEIKTNLGDFAPQSHPFIQVQNKLNKVFGGLNQVSIAVEVKKGDIFNRDTLSKVIRLTNELYLMQGINAGRISSLSARKIKHVTADEEGFYVQRVLRDAPADEEGMRQLEMRIAHNPNVFIRMVSKDFKSTLIQADFESGVSSRQIFQSLRKLIKKEKDANTNIYLAGRPILEGWLDYYLPKMLSIFLLTLAIIAIILYFTFRSKRGVFLPLLDSSMATIWGLGAMKLFGFRLEPCTVLVPFLILSISISHSVHFMKRYYELMKDKDKHSKEAVRESIDSLFKPALASVVTDGLGFLSLLLIPLVSIRSMAAAAGFGVLFNFPSSFMFTPVILSYLKRPKILEVVREEKHTIVDRLLRRCSYVCNHRRTRRIVIGLFLILAIVGLLGIRRTVIGDNSEGSSHLYPNSPYNLAEKFINEKFGGTNSYYIYVQTEPDGLIDSSRLKKMDDLQRYLKNEVKQAGFAISLVDYIKGLNMAMFAGDRAYFKIPENNRTIAEYLFLYSLSAYPGDFQPVVSIDYSKANIKVDLKDHKASTINTLIAKTKQWLKENELTPDTKFLYAGGDIGILAAINEIIRKNLLLNLILISVLVFGYVAVAFSSFQAGLLLLIPLILSVIIIIGIFGFLNISLTVETLPLAALSIGLGINYGIYVLTRLYQERKIKGMSFRKSIRLSLLSSGKAVFFSGMIVTLGTLVWMFSDIRLQAMLGIILGIALILNMIGTLLLLPSLISILKPRFIIE